MKTIIISVILSFCLFSCNSNLTSVEIQETDFPRTKLETDKNLAENVYVIKSELGTKSVYEFVVFFDKQGQLERFNTMLERPEFKSVEYIWKDSKTVDFHIIDINSKEYIFRVSGLGKETTTMEVVG